MTVANQTRRIAAVGNAAIGQEVPFSFPYAATSDITVYSRVTATGVETLLAETTNYTLTAASDTGGTLTTVTAVAATSEIHIIRDTPKTQALDLEAGGSFNAENQEDAFDKSIKLIIENKDSLDRALRAPATDAVALDLELPDSVTRASKNLGFDASGNVTVTDSSGTFATQTAVWNDVKAKAPARDIRAYGAVEDGTTDNSVAIQKAIDAAEQDATQDRGRGKVLAPCVTGLSYMCDDDLQLKDQIIITGGGMIEFSGTYGFESNSKDGWVIDGITILGSEAANQTGIYIHNSSKKFWIRNNQFYNFQTAIFVTKSWIFRIDDNDMFLSGVALNNIVCIKLTSGEGNCSKGTAYGIINEVKIRGNMLHDFGAAPNTTPLIHIGDSALAPVDPKAITHAKNIDISGNTFTGHLSENAIELENTYMVTIERNWFESLVGPCVYLGGQWGTETVIRANGFWGNNNDGYMDPPIKVDSTVDWMHNNLTIANNVFNSIHANHNLIEADYVNGLVLDNNNGLVQARVLLTNCTGVDLREPRWVENHLFYDSDELVYENEYLTYTTYL